MSSPDLTSTVPFVRAITHLLSPSQRRTGIWLLLLMVIGMGMEMLGVGMLLPTLAVFVEPGAADQYPLLQSVAQEYGAGRFVFFAMLLLSAVYAVKTAFLAFLAWRKARFAYDVQAELSERLFACYLHQPWSFHLQRNSAQLIRNAYGETGLFAAHGLIPGMMLISEGMVFLGIAGLLLYVEPLGAAIVVLVLGLTAGTFNRFTKHRIARWGADRQHHDGLRIQHLQQGIGGAKDVKLLGREADFLQQFRVHNNASAQVGYRWQAIQEFPRLLLELIGVLGMTALVGVLVARGRPVEMIVPTLGLFAAGGFKLMPSINRMLTAYQKMRYVGRVIETLSAELQLASESGMQTAGRSIGRLRESVELRDVAFSYPGKQDALFANLSVRIDAGASVGIIGESGVGKSTIVDLILGLLHPDAGRVVVDGIDVQEDIRGWQDQIGYVPQVIYLTDDTLRRNVAFGVPSAQIDDAAVERAIQAAQLQEFVAGLPDGLDTLVGERGVRLSGGQRQRVGIARALYHNPSVLVLDEATSSLDTVTEQGVMEAVRALRADKTIIIVAHRLTTVEYCDRILRVKDGHLHDAASLQDAGR